MMLSKAAQRCVLFLLPLIVHFAMYPLKIGSDDLDFVSDLKEKDRIKETFPDGSSAARGKALAVTVLVVLLWLFQPIPAHITALVPLVRAHDDSSQR